MHPGCGGSQAAGASLTRGTARQYRATLEARIAERQGSLRGHASAQFEAYVHAARSRAAAV